MFDRLPLFPMLPAADLARARAWYERHLGAEPTLEMREQEINVYRNFVSYRSQHAGTAQNTAAIWYTDDFDSAVRQLRDRSVSLETYEMPELSWADGVATDPSGARVCWFTDSEGNILAVAEPPPHLELPAR